MHADAAVRGGAGDRPQGRPGARRRGPRVCEEILDHCPDLKYREFRALIALAVDARDETRKAMPGAETMERRTRCRKRATLTALASLREKGVIKAVSGSAPGRRAVYEICSPLPTAAAISARRRGNRGKHRRTRTGAPIDAPEPDNGCTHESTRTGARMSAPTGARMSAPPPSVPSEIPSYTGAETAPTAQTILAAFIDWDRGNGGQLTKRATGQLAKQIAALLTEGIDGRHRRTRLARHHLAPLALHPPCLAPGLRLPGLRKGPTMTNPTPPVPDTAYTAAAEAADRGYGMPLTTAMRVAIEAAAPAIRADERERCAQLAESVKAVATADEGTQCYFADLLRETP